MLPDEDSASVDSLLSATGGRNLVPPVFPYEMANLLLTATRRGRLERTHAALLLAEVEILRLEVSVEGQRASRLHELSADHGITAYDAAYLSLAIATGEPLATLDLQLRSVAEQVGVDVV